MFTKKLNTFILVASQVLNFAIIMFFAMLLAKLVWWVINPTIGDVYVEKMSATQFDSSAKYVVNRYPFGVIVKAKAVEEAPPQIVDQIKVTGIYRGGSNDSMALIEASGKTLVYRIGAMIMGSATLKAINSDGVVVSEDGREAVIKISNGSGVAGVIPSPSSSHFGGQQQEFQQAAPPPGSVTDSTVSDFKERRRKMIEEFAQQRGSGSDGNGGSVNNSATPAPNSPSNSGNLDNTAGNTNNGNRNGSNGNPDNR